MDPERFATLTRALSVMLSRRNVAGALGLSTAGLSNLVEARKKRTKRKRRKRKKECGKVGGNPIKGTCCKGSVAVDGSCQRCDVCTRGCAYATVQAAIEAATAGATIAICPGTYAGNLSIAKDLRFIGAGGGAKGTIVQGSGDAPVVYIAANVISLEHLRITGGGGIFRGGGIVNNAGTVELVSCTVSGNNGQIGHGGGIYNAGGTLTLRNSTVRENYAGSGGGVYNAGTLHLIASDISGNQAGEGGGLFNDASLTADAGSRITTNTATGQGGGIYNNFGGSVTLASSTIVTDNTPNNCVGSAVANCSD